MVSILSRPQCVNASLEIYIPSPRNGCLLCPLSWGGIWMGRKNLNLLRTRFTVRSYCHPHLIPSQQIKFMQNCWFKKLFVHVESDSDGYIFKSNQKYILILLWNMLKYPHLMALIIWNLYKLCIKSQNWKLVKRCPKHGWLLGWIYLQVLVAETTKLMKNYSYSFQLSNHDIQNAHPFLSQNNLSKRQYSILVLVG